MDLDGTDTSEVNPSRTVAKADSIIEINVDEFYSIGSTDGD